MLNYVGPDISAFIMTYQFIIADLSSWLPAWALLLTNSSLRKAIYETLIKAPKGSVTNSMVFTVIGNR